MKKFQIKTHGNENLARAIQDKLYELGYKWPFSEKFGRLNKAAYQVGVHRDREITFHEELRNQWGPVITIDELFAMTPEPKETIRIGDQTFNKADFEEATKDLKPVNQ